MLSCFVLLIGTLTSIFNTDDLGNQRFEIRQHASEYFYEHLNDSREVLEQGAKSSDYEIKTRCRRLLDEYYNVTQGAEISIFCLPQGGRVHRKFIMRYYAIAFNDLHPEYEFLLLFDDVENRATEYWFFDRMKEGMTRQEALLQVDRMRARHPKRPKIQTGTSS